MISQSYEFDPCTIDDGDQEDLSLDGWKPKPKVQKLVKSDWRQEQNERTKDTRPGLDEIGKIKAYLAKKHKDSEIMDAFGISSEILVAIKRDCYDAITGISLDNQSKIYKEFTSIHKKLDRAFEALRFIGDNVLDASDDFKKKAYKAILGPPKKKRKRHEDDEEE